MTARREKLTPVPNPRHRKAQRAQEAAAEPAPPDLSHITPGLRHLARPIALLQFHGRNPRKHSEANVEAIRASLRQNGQYRPAIASDRTGELVVVVGNGMLAAALAEGWTHLAVEVKTLSEARENQLAITDNQTAALAEWDRVNLAELLKDLDTGNDPELDRMMADLAADEKLIPPDPDRNRRPPAAGGAAGGASAPDGAQAEGGDGKDKKSPALLSYSIVFDDTAQQDAWLAFVHRLGQLYPEVQTLGARLKAHLDSQTADGIPGCACAGTGQ